MQESNLNDVTLQMNEILMMQEEERILANDLIKYIVEDNKQLKSIIIDLENRLKEKDAQVEQMQNKLIETNLQAVAHQQKVHELECQLREFEGLKAHLIVSKQKEFNEIAAKRDQSISAKMNDLKALSVSCESMHKFYQINVSNLDIINEKINVSINKLQIAQEKQATSMNKTGNVNMNIL